MLKSLFGGKEFVVYNGYAYCTLAGHHPHSTANMMSNKMYLVDFPWELCPNSRDARHVCGTYPWGTEALVFADGSACLTKNAEAKFEGAGPRSENCLKEEGGKYGAKHVNVPKVPKHYWDDWGYDIAAESEVLLRCRLPF
jgi:hypothetical protein